jgi:hypothetical protein
MRLRRAHRREQLRRLASPLDHAVLGSPDREPCASLSELPQQLGLIRLAVHHEPRADAGRAASRTLLTLFDGCTPVLHLRVSLTTTKVARLLLALPPLLLRRCARPELHVEHAVERAVWRDGHRVHDLESARRKARRADRAERLGFRAVRQNQARPIHRHVDVLVLRASPCRRSRRGSSSASERTFLFDIKSYAACRSAATGTPLRWSLQAAGRPVPPTESADGCASHHRDPHCQTLREPTPFLRPSPLNTPGITKFPHFKNAISGQLSSRGAKVP